MRKTRFKTLIRIDPKTKEWIRKNKDCKTMAGFLDKLINFCKKRYGLNANFRVKNRVNGEKRD